MSHTGPTAGAPGYFHPSSLPLLSYTVVARLGGVSRARAYQRTQAWIARGLSERRARIAAARSGPGQRVRRGGRPKVAARLSADAAGLRYASVYARARRDRVSLDAALVELVARRAARRVRGWR